MRIDCDFGKFENLTEEGLRGFAARLAKWAHRLGQSDWRVLVRPYGRGDYGEGLPGDFAEYNMSYGHLGRAVEFKLKDRPGDEPPGEIDVCSMALKLLFADCNALAGEHLPPGVKESLTHSYISIVRRLADMLAGLMPGEG